MGRPATPAPAWTTLIRLALIGVLLAAVYPVSAARNDSLLVLITPSPTLNVDMIDNDFPGHPPIVGNGHDGEQFYAMAREPMHLRNAAEHIERPHYRMQRILFPVLAWALHPSGGGPGLVIAMVVVGLAAIALCIAAVGSLSVALGGRVEVGLAVVITPAAYWTLRVSTSDMLAVGLALTAVVLSLRRRPVLAIVAGVGAVLAKEPALLVLVGFALWRRDREGVLLAAVPAAVAAAWFVLLRLLVVDNSQGIVEFTLPGNGYREAWDIAWSQGVSMDGLAVTALTLVLALVALVRHGVRGPLGWIIVLHLALFSVMNKNVVGIADNMSRASAPLLLCSLVALVVPRPGTREEELARLDEVTAGPAAPVAAP